MKLENIILLNEGAEPQYNQSGLTKLYKEYVEGLFNVGDVFKSFDVKIPNYEALKSGTERVEISLTVDPGVYLRVQVTGQVLRTLYVIFNGSEEGFQFGESEELPFEDIVMPKLYVSGLGDKSDGRSGVFIRHITDKSNRDMASLRKQIELIEFKERNSIYCIKQDYPVDLQEPLFSQLNTILFQSSNDEHSAPSQNRQPLVLKNKEMISLGVCFPDYYIFDASAEKLSMSEGATFAVQNGQTFAGKIIAQNAVFSLSIDAYIGLGKNFEDYLFSLAKITKVTQQLIFDNLGDLKNPDVVRILFTTAFIIANNSGLGVGSISFGGSPNRITSALLDLLEECLDNGVTIHELDEIIEEFLDENIK